MIKKIRKLIKDGLLHIIGASTINKIISLCSGIIIVRVLSKSDYGVYSYVLNIVNIVLLLNGLGTLTGMMQYGCEEYKSNDIQNGLLKYGFKVGLLFNVMLSCLIVIYGVFFPKSIDNTSCLFVLAACIPITNFIEQSYLTIYRVKEKNKTYSVFSSVNSATVLLFILMGACFFSVAGAITFRYIAAVLTMIYGWIFTKDIKEVLVNNTKIDKTVKTGFLKFSLVSCANNSISHLFYNADIFIIGIMIASAETIASYKVATTIPLALTFLTSAIITYIYPKIVKHRFEYKWLRRYYLRLIIAVSIMNGVLALILLVIAPHVIGLVFGTQYVETSVDTFRILVVGFFVSASFRMPAGNVLDMLHLIRPNFIISIVCGILNILFDIILIFYFGSVGAAIATLSIYILYGILSNAVIVLYLRKCAHSSN